MVDRSDIFTYSGSYSGGGAFRQLGTGTTILTGNNTYAGGTTISAGMLQLGAGGTSGSINGDVTNNGVLSFNRSNTMTFGGLISGAGSVQQLGTGTTILTGNNTYTGGTTVSAGMLQLGAGGTSGSIVGDMLNNATLAFNRSNTLTFDGLISGTGSVQQIGTGTTILTGNNTYTGGTTVSAGMLQLGAGGTSGSIVGDMLNNATLAFNRSNTLTFDGLISGTGSVQQIGTGTTILTGNNTYTGGTTVSAGMLQLGAGGTSGSIVGAITNNAFLEFVNADTSGITSINNNGTTTFDSGTNAGTASITNNGGGSSLVSFSGASSAASATVTTNSGALTQFLGNSTAGSAQLITNAGGGISFFNASTAGSATITNNGGGTTLFLDSSSGGTARLIATGTGVVDFSGLASAGTTAGSLEGAGKFFLGSKTITVGGNNLSTEVSGVIRDGGSSGGVGGALVKEGAGTLTLSGTNTYTGGTTISAGTLQLGNGGASGSIVGDVLNNATLAFNRSNTLTFDGLISGTGSVQQIGPGTTILTNNNGYTGGTTVNAGALIVNGSIAASSGLTVDAGALVGGVGTLPTTTINGALSPGKSISTITVNGRLTFGAGGTYVVEVSPSTADRTDVTGTATLAGTVLASFGGGNSFKKEYVILHADGGLGGTFGSLSASGVPTGFKANLSYDANDVFLDLIASLGTSVSGLNQNQRSVATAINTYFNNGGALPPNFVSLFGLTGQNLANALTQLSGEAATGAQYGAFQLGNLFFSLMLDPLVYRNGGFGGVGGAGVVIPGGGGAMRLAAHETQAPEIALAYAKVLKEPPAPAAILWEPRWNVWAGGYGGANRTQGDPLGVGSHDVSARAGGYAGGVDYRIWPGTTVGMALAGGFTNWSLANGLGTGNSDAFQAGLYGITRSGPAYLAGAASFTEYWFATDRTAFAGDHLTARFGAQSYGGRLEGGWRFATFLGGIAPYAAVQAQTFHAPSYSEADQTLGGFGLNYNARDGSDTRSELGARFDRTVLVMNTAVLALNARAAWAHDWVTNPSLMPAFQALPGASFIVNGATPVSNSALASAGAELRFLNGWTIGARFDGEFANRAQTYAGTGIVRYAW